MSNGSMLTPTPESGPEVQPRFGELGDRLAQTDYNFRRFRTKHLLMDGKATMKARGIEPGEIAPDFELEQAGGGRLRLSRFRGKAVLLHFGSLTCPITRGSIEPLKKLWDFWGDAVQFITVLVR